MSRRAIDADWLRERYPTCARIEDLLEDYERDFGWRPTVGGVQMRAHRLGIKKMRIEGIDRAERRVRWSDEPEMLAWMLENDHGQRTDVLSVMFRDEFGFGLSKNQITTCRAAHGKRVREGHGGGKDRLPVGTERKRNGGYVYVKVSADPSEGQTRDNWVPKHRIVWERENGTRLPDDMVVLFADKDKGNFDPDNLVAVPRDVVGILNNDTTPDYRDRETLEACVALARLKSAIRDAEFSAPRTCEVCGREFVPEGAQRGYKSPVRTCKACRGKGLKASGRRAS